MLRYLTAGESHGHSLTAILEGMVSGLKIDPEQINKDLARRQGGYGRGKRMAIEQDKVRILSGLRKDRTIGSPITVVVVNKDFKIESLPDISRPRPGHADLPGSLKYHQNIRDVLERASARQTAVRVAIGGICKLLLKEFNIEVLAHVVNIAGIEADTKELSFSDLKNRVDQSDLNCADPQAEKKMKEKIDEAIKANDSLGGIFEIAARGLPIGLGSYVQPDRKLTSRLAGALMSIPAIKAIEFGLGFKLASIPGSEAHDEIFSTALHDAPSEQSYYLEKKKDFFRPTNNAGGLEGGMTNGQPLIIRCCMKPIPTLGQPLTSVDLETGNEARAAVERSDICAVPAAGIVGQAVTAYELASSLLEKFGGDSLTETLRNYHSYIADLHDQVQGLKKNRL